jgi:hypothetical protein
MLALFNCISQRACSSLIKHINYLRLPLHLSVFLVLFSDGRGDDELGLGLNFTVLARARVVVHFNYLLPPNLTIGCTKSAGFTLSYGYRVVQFKA